MRVRIVRTFQAGSQTLNAGLLCEPAAELARDWIAQGLAEALDDGEKASSTASPALDGMSDAPPAKHARRAKG